MLLFEDLTGLVIWLLVTITIVNVVFLCFVFYRRLARKRYYAIKDAARERYQPVITEFFAGQITVEKGIQLLAGAKTRPELDAMEEMLLQPVASSDRQRISELLLGTGHVERWVRQAFGRRRGREVLRSAIRGQTPPPEASSLARVMNPILRLRILSVPRAIAIDHLGWLATSLAGIFATEALKDPAAEVRSTAISIIGRNHDPTAVPLLVEELERAVSQDSDLSLRGIKLALVCYGSDDLPYFVPYLTHKLPRVRFFLVDAIAQICARTTRGLLAASPDSSRGMSSSSRNVSSSSRHGSSSGSSRGKSSRGLLLNKNDFSRDFYDVFIGHLVADQFADVRARSSGVIRHFRDSRTAEALRNLLRDENEFVRLHTARACADRSYAILIPDLARLLEDSKWRVREAAAQSLRAFGHDGVRELYRQFIDTKDRYTSEQVTEEIQRSGAIEDLAASLVPANPDFVLAEAVCRKMILMGKTSLLLNVMASPMVPAEARAVIMTAMAAAPPPEFVAVLQVIADTDTGPLGMKARSLLETPSGIRAASASSGTRSSSRGANA